MNAPAPRARVLAVDDTAADRKLLRHKLEAEGFYVLEAGDGVTALELLRREPIDAVISDILMPRLDGYRLCAELRRDPRLAQIRFVLHTSSYTSPADEQLAYRFGADAFLRKPAATPDLARALTGPERRAPAPDTAGEHEQMEVLHQYSDALVRKLEQKNTELETTKTELERLNRELEQRVDERTSQLRAANYELEQFAHAVAHDLRAPLRAIQGYSAILGSECLEPLSEECRDHFRHIPDAARRMSDLIEDLLRLSRVTHAPLRREPVNLIPLTRDVLADLARESPERRVTLRLPPSLQLDADPRLLLIVLENLLANAWKFTSRRPDALIALEPLPGSEPGFVVRDNGVGFAPKDADRLFTPFTRLHHASAFPGTGVGLATVQRIVHRHGGRVWAEARPDEGAAFHIVLPPPPPAPT
jgi:signal transduction histidine kinase